jgi:hypothetical protein
LAGIEFLGAIYVYWALEPGPLGGQRAEFGNVLDVYLWKALLFHSTPALCENNINSASPWPNINVKFERYRAAFPHNHNVALVIIIDFRDQPTYLL